MGLMHAAEESYDPRHILSDRLDRTIKRHDDHVIQVIGLDIIGSDFLLTEMYALGLALPGAGPWRMPSVSVWPCTFLCANRAVQTAVVCGDDWGGYREDAGRMGAEGQLSHSHPSQPFCPRAWNKQCKQFISKISSHCLHQWKCQRADFHRLLSPHLAFLWNKFLVRWSRPITDASVALQKPHPLVAVLRVTSPPQSADLLLPHNPLQYGGQGP